MSISRETFNILKRFTKVIFQQGVPVVDADFNEAQQIQRITVQKFLNDYVGNGSPNNGFKVEADGPVSADIKLTAGTFVLSGFLFTLESDILAGLDLSNTSGGTKTFKLYLKLVEEESLNSNTSPPSITTFNDFNDIDFLGFGMTDANVGIETSKRRHLNVTINSTEGSVPADTTTDFHVQIATVVIAASQLVVNAVDITDNRIVINIGQINTDLTATKSEVEAARTDDNTPEGVITHPNLKTHLDLIWAKITQKFAQLFQKETHTNGIIGAPLSTTSSLFPSILNTGDAGFPPVGTPVGTVALVNLKSLLIATESVYVGGERDAEVTPRFIDNGGTLDDAFSNFSTEPDGTYTVYLQQAAEEVTVAKVLTSGFVIDADKFEICQVLFASGILSNLIDRRKFGSISNKDLHDDTIDLTTKATTASKDFLLDRDNHIGTQLFTSITGQVSDAQHGSLVLNTTSRHANVTTSIDGFMSAGDKIILDGLSAGGEITDSQHGDRSNRPSGGTASTPNLGHPLGTGSAQPGFSDNNFSDALLSKINAITTGAKKIHIFVCQVEAFQTTTVSVINLLTSSATNSVIVRSTGNFPAGISVIGWCGFGPATVFAVNTGTNETGTFSFLATLTGTAGGALGAISTANGNGNSSNTWSFSNAASAGGASSSMRVTAEAVFIGLE